MRKTKLFVIAVMLVFVAGAFTACQEDDFATTAYKGIESCRVIYKTTLKAAQTELPANSPWRHKLLLAAHVYRGAYLEAQGVLYEYKKGLTDKHEVLLAIANTLDKQTTLLNDFKAAGLNLPPATQEALGVLAAVLRSLDQFTGGE